MMAVMLASWTEVTAMLEAGADVRARNDRGADTPSVIRLLGSARPADIPIVDRALFAPAPATCL